MPTARIATLAEEVERRLRLVSDPERAEGERAYLKSELQHVGASVPAIRRVATAIYRENADLAHDDLIDLVEVLWERPVHERRVAAVELLGLALDRLSSGDAPVLERLLRESRTWALVDPLAVNVVGGLIEQDPDVWDPILRRWAVDDDRWIRRSSLLAHLRGLRAGAGDFARFGTLADGMLDERDFFIRKAIGWVLRETGKHRPELVVGWLATRAPRAAGLTVREAVKYLPEEDRQRILAAHA